MDTNLIKLWDKCLDIIRDNIPEKVFTTWFADITPVKFEGQTLTIQVKSNFVYEFLEENFVDLLRTTLFRVMGNGTQLMYSILTDKDNNLSVEVETNNHPVINKVQKKNSATLQAGTEKESVHELDPMLNTRYNFDNFVEGSSNRLPRSAAESVSVNPGKTFNPLFVHGSSGVGKTHLINAIGVKIKENNTNLRVLYISAHLFQVQYTDSILQKNFNDFMRFYQSIDVLIIDDIQEFAGLPGTQNAFFHIFNHLHLNGKQLIMTSDRSPAQLKGMEDRLITRFKWGLSAELEKPDVELRKNILKSKIRKDGLKFPEEVVSFIAEHVNASVRDLEGIVVSIMAHSTINNRDIDLELAQRVVGQVTDYEMRPITIEQILEKVADYYNIEIQNVQSKSRKRAIVQVRQVSMYLAKKHIDMSVAKIGHYIGGRDHATVLHACKTITNQLETNKQFRNEINEIEIAIQRR